MGFIAESLIYLNALLKAITHTQLASSLKRMATILNFWKHFDGSIKPELPMLLPIGAFDRVNTIFSVFLFSRKFNCIESITLNLNAHFDFQNPLPSKRGRKLNWFYCLKIKLKYIFTWALLRTILLAGPHQRLIHNYQTYFSATLKKKNVCKTGGL